MAFFKDDLSWYPAKVLARKLTGYLIQYNDDRYMEIVPDKFLRLMEPSKDQTENGASTTSEARQIKIHKGRYIPRDPIVKHVPAKVFKIIDHVQIEEEKEKSYRRLEHKEEIIKAGTKILAYFRDDKQWYPAKVIGRKSFGYLVRYEDDKFMQILPPKYLKIC
ncbi:uncharacterized protein LOC127712182 [Mytilus californianus]|uniref:uncharacterized protein LOC127712182 n=1 Tax=Mytilus californianus TaxID=6549 RepID=UPI0022452582|nr:uncharacterized protein LOC127712182 [Mytilus californianus]